MKKQVMYSVVLLMTLAALVSVSVYAAGDGQNSEQERRKGPPPEAFELCKDKSAGDSVSITSPEGDKVEGVCKEMNGQMVAVPANMQGQGGQRRQ